MNISTMFTYVILFFIKVSWQTFIYIGAMSNRGFIRLDGRRLAHGQSATTFDFLTSGLLDLWRRLRTLFIFQTGSRRTLYV